jgi:hypothetical protein
MAVVLGDADRAFGAIELRAGFEQFAARWMLPASRERRRSRCRLAPTCALRANPRREFRRYWQGYVRLAGQAYSLSGAAKAMKTVGSSSDFSYYDMSEPRRSPHGRYSERIGGSWGLRPGGPDVTNCIRHQRRPWRIGNKGAPYSTRWHQVWHRAGATGQLPAVHRHEWRYGGMIMSPSFRRPAPLGDERLDPSWQVGPRDLTVPTVDIVSWSLRRRELWQWGRVAHQANGWVDGRT